MAVPIGERELPQVLEASEDLEVGGGRLRLFAAHAVPLAPRRLRHLGGECVAAREIEGTQALEHAQIVGQLLQRDAAREVELLELKPLKLSAKQQEWLDSHPE